MKWKKGRKVEAVEKVKGSPNSLIVKVEGDNNTVQVNQHVYRLASNKDVLEAVEATLAPIQQSKDAKAIEFREDDKPITVLDREEVKAIVEACEAGPTAITSQVIEEVAQTKTVTATLYTYGPVFDAKAHNWRFLYQRKPVYADVRETSIARDAVRRGGSFLNDRYKVKMEVTPPATEEGTHHYKIVDVLEFTPAEQQIPLPLRKSRKKIAKTAKKKRAAR